MKKLTLVAVCCFALLPACASDPKRAPTSEEVAAGEALPPAPPVPAHPASTDSPTAPTVPAAASASSPTAAPAEAPAPLEALSEAQMAKVSDLVNNAEVEQAKLAQKKAKTPAVKAFADKMVKHHGEALRQQAKLVKKLGLTPADSATATALKADGVKALEALKSADAAAFESVYVKSQVDGHQKALDLLDTQLLPNAKTPEVAEALRQARAAVEQHLNEARALQAK